LKGNTGPGTVQTPLGIALRARGLEGGDDGTLEIALDALARDASDSDGDHQTDIAELQAGIDPNSRGNARIDAANEPSFGCGWGEEGEGEEGACMPIFFMTGLWSRRRSRKNRR
jgi:hypothetical protein